MNSMEKEKFIKRFQSQKVQIDTMALNLIEMHNKLNEVYVLLDLYSLHHKPDGRDPYYRKQVYEWLEENKHFSQHIAVMGNNHEPW